MAFDKTVEWKLFFAVTGCADLDPVEGAEVARNRDVTTVTCLTDAGRGRRSWSLRCNATTGRWVGEYETCHQGECGAGQGRGPSLTSTSAMFGKSRVFFCKSVSTDSALPG